MFNLFLASNLIKQSFTVPETLNQLTKNDDVNVTTISTIENHYFRHKNENKQNVKFFKLINFYLFIFFRKLLKILKNVLKNKMVIKKFLLKIIKHFIEQINYLIQMLILISQFYLQQKNNYQIELILKIY